VSINLNTPPSQPRSDLARTSLGAVGGARGVGAGALRLIIEFLTTFNPEAVKKMEQEIQRLTALQKQQNGELNQLEQTRLALQTRLNQARTAAVGLDRKQVEQINQLGARYANIGKLQGAQLQQQLALRDAEVKAIAAATGLDERDILALSQKRALQLQINDYLDLEVAKRREIAATNRQLNAQQTTYGRAQGASNIGGGLAALGIGAIGAAAGFAVLGPILSGVSEWMDKVVQSTIDLIDPSQKAAAALKEVADEVNRIADQESLSRLDAAKKLISELTPTGQAALQFSGIELDPNLLEKAALNQQIAESLKLQLQLMLAQKDSEAAVRAELAQIVALQYAQRGLPNPFDPLVVTTQVLGGNFGSLISQQQSMNSIIDQQLQQTIGLSQEEQRRRNTIAQQNALYQQQRGIVEGILADIMSAEFNAAVDANIGHLQESLERSMDISRRVEEAQINVIQGGLNRTINGINDRAEQRLDALQNRLERLSNIGPSARTKALQAALDDLANKGPSARTLQLQRALEGLGKAEEQREYRSRLADVARDRREIQLKRQLDLTNREIDIYKYRGRERLIAIDAALEQQEKANEAQAKYNKLLEIQYQFTRQLTRQEGESIQEFIERRAQRNRELLQEAAELRQDDKADSLENERDRTQYLIDLEENTARRRDIIRDRQAQLERQRLQRQLRASQEHDRKVLESQRKALQDRLRASQDADRRGLESRRKAIQQEMDRVREQSQNDIEQARRVADARIASTRKAFEDSRDTLRRQVEITIEQERERARQVAIFANKAEVLRLQQAIAGARDMQELNKIAGYLAGSNFSDAYIRSQLQILGVDPWTAAQILGNINQTRGFYQQKLNFFQFSNLSPFNFLKGGAPGFSEGGVFDLTNGMNFGKNARFGEGRTELGVVLSNRVTQALRETRQQPMIGNINMTTQNPTRDMYYLKRTIREVIREELP
jgi:hypothetical protein